MVLLFYQELMPKLKVIWTKEIQKVPDHDKKRTIEIVLKRRLENQASEERNNFLLHKVVKGLFECFEDMLRIKIEKCARREKIYIDNLTYSQLFDFQGDLYLIHDIISKERLGYFYLDPFRRYGKTPGTCTQYILYKPLRVFRLATNFSPSTNETPSLLRHDDVITLFHEFGHVIKHMFSSMKNTTTKFQCIKATFRRWNDLGELRSKLLRPSRPYMDDPEGADPTCLGTIRSSKLRISPFRNS